MQIIQFLPIITALLGGTFALPVNPSFNDHEATVIKREPAVLPPTYETGPSNPEPRPIEVMPAPRPILSPILIPKPRPILVRPKPVPSAIVKPSPTPTTGFDDETVHILPFPSLDEPEEPEPTVVPKPQPKPKPQPRPLPLPEPLKQYRGKKWPIGRLPYQPTPTKVGQVENTYKDSSPVA